MKLKDKAILREFIDNLMDTIAYDYKNDFVGALVTEENESELAELMHEAGFHDFQSKPWPSLYLSVDEFKKRPYHANVSYEGIANKGRVAFETRTIPGHQLFNVEAIVNDPNKELNDSMTLRALDSDYEAQVLTLDGDTWMLDIYSEAFTIDPLAQKANGNVLTMGLGMGYFIYMAMLNDTVETITVIEKDPFIIDLFTTYILPQFPNTIPVNIIETDAITHFTKEYLESFDYVFVDTYQSSDDGYLMMEAMLEEYLPEVNHVDFWIEDSCVEFIRSLIVIYFDLTLEDMKVSHSDPFYNRILQKVVKYMESVEGVVDTQYLKDLMYDRDTLRRIIAIK